MKNTFKSLILASLLLSGEVFSKECGGGAFTLGGNGASIYDEDNPDPIASFFEPKINKISRLKKKSLYENLNFIYGKIVPEYEKSAWIKNRSNISDYGTYGSYRWASKNDKDHILDITYEEISFKNYKNINELIDVYNKKIHDNVKCKCSINILEQTPTSVVFEIDSIERDVSDTLKNNTQIKSIEKWLIYNDWVLNLSYSLRTKGDKEKNDLWNQLKNTWEKRFANIIFDGNKNQ